MTRNLRLLRTSTDAHGREESHTLFLHTPLNCFQHQMEKMNTIKGYKHVLYERTKFTMQLHAEACEATKGCEAL